jgi:hypothetical protein
LGDAGEDYRQQSVCSGVVGGFGGHGDGIDEGDDIGEVDVDAHGAVVFRPL